ncbi:MAG: magnesium and cobalt transporter [Gammaproteobacteria bacterium]|jgi:magnesium and cobalt transporter
MSLRGGLTWLERLGQVLSGEPQNRDELVEILRDAQSRGLVGIDVLAIVEGALHVGDLQVRDIMIPRSQMVVVSADSAPEDFVSVVVESGHSRFPVVGDNRDQVEGVLLAKDLLAYFAAEEHPNFDLDDVMRPVVYIPESKRLNVLLAEFRANRNHMAIVVDEYGGVAGLVTIEDVIEQIVGEIDDEHDGEDEDGYIRRLTDGEHSVKALTPIEDFNEFFNTTISDEDFDTVGGLVIKALGHLPKRGESVDVSGLTFHVLRADQRRVHLLRVVPSTPSDD